MKHILVVDDQPEVRELIKVTLEVGPYQIHEAHNGQQALDLARQQTMDVILLDIMMPEGPDGLEVCRTLKSDPDSGSPTIIMLTARGQDADIEAGFEAGADDYFVKPFSPLELIQKIESVLGT